MFDSTPFKTLTRGLLVASVLALLAVASVSAQPHELNVSTGLTGQGAPLALRGYDPVSYVVAGEPQIGSAEHSVAHGGATYRFVSKKNLQRFERDPERYLPAYGGFCAFGVSVGAKFDGDPLVWKIVDGQLYLNLNRQIQKSWEADIDGAIRKADSHWPRIRHAAPDTLKPQG